MNVDKYIENIKLQLAGCFNIIVNGGIIRILRLDKFKNVTDAKRSRNIIKKALADTKYSYYFKFSTLKTENDDIIYLIAIHKFKVNEVGKLFNEVKGIIREVKGMQISFNDYIKSIKLQLMNCLIMIKHGSIIKLLRLIKLEYSFDAEELLDMVNSSLINTEILCHFKLDIRRSKKHWYTCLIAIPKCRKTGKLKG